MTRRWTAILAVVLVAMAVAGCGDDDEGAVATTATSAAPAETTTTVTEPPAGTDCPDTPFSGTVSSEGDDTNAAFSLTDGEVVLAAAFGLGERVQYTVYLADYDLAGQEIGSDTIEAAPGQVVVTLQARNPDGVEIEIGVPYDETFVIMDSGGGAMGTPDEPEGTVTFLDVGEDRICFDIDFSDTGKVLRGTISAEVVGGFGF